jgi:hypothetical protein
MRDGKDEELHFYSPEDRIMLRPVGWVHDFAHRVTQMFAPPP